MKVVVDSSVVNDGSVVGDCSAVGDSAVVTEVSCGVFAVVEPGRDDGVRPISVQLTISEISNHQSKVLSKYLTASITVLSETISLLLHVCSVRILTCLY